MADEGGSKSFWTTLPGLITAIAALITALVGAYALISANSGSDDEDAASSNAGGGGTSQGQDDEPPSSPEPSGSSAPSAAPSAAAGSPQDGTALLRPGDWLDVDTGQSGGSSFGELNWSGSQFNLYAPKAALTDQVADLAACESLLGQRKDSYLAGEQLRSTNYLCITTEQSGIAFLTVAPSDARNQLPVTWTLWP